MRFILGSMCALAITALVMGAVQDGQKKTVQGELIDMHCYTAGDATGQKHAECATKCMSSGIPAGVLVEGEAWTLLTNPAPLAPHAAKTIRVTGELHPQTRTIAPERIEVQDGPDWKPVEMRDAHHGG